MALALFNILVAVVLGYGAVEELWVRGVRGGETQPLVVGIVGALVCLLLLLAGVARLRRSAGERRLAVASGLLLILFHLYAALPPHRNVGIAVAAVATIYGLVLLFARPRRGDDDGARRAAEAAS